MDEDAYDVMAGYVNMEYMGIIKENFEEGGKVNMCEGIKGWIEKEVAMGSASSVKAKSKFSKI